MFPMTGWTPEPVVKALATARSEALATDLAVLAAKPISYGLVAVAYTYKVSRVCTHPLSGKYAIRTGYGTVKTVGPIVATDRS